MEWGLPHCSSGWDSVFPMQAGLSSIPGQETGSHMPQRSPGAAKYKRKFKRHVVAWKTDLKGQNTGRETNEESIVIKGTG